MDSVAWSTAIIDCTCNAGYSGPAGGPCSTSTSEAPADRPHVLILVVKMPHTKAEFDGAKQGLFKDAIASAAGTSPLNVGILSIAEARRRDGSIEVETKISAMDAASLQALSSTLGTGDSMLAKINAELTKRGLPASTVVSVKYKKSGLSDGAIAGMVFGFVK